MDRRHFLHMTAAISLVTSHVTQARNVVMRANAMDTREFHATRKFVKLTVGRIAYVERGRGPAALFLHGMPLNGFQWRHALSQLSEHRRCIAPDFLGVGYTETNTDADLHPEAQVAMLADFLDALNERSVDLVANDSGGGAAQLFAVRYPERVRTLILTNCDAGSDSPPEVIKPGIADAHAGLAADKNIGGFLRDRQFARSSKGLGVAYAEPDFLTDELLDVYLQPLVSSPLRKRQFNLAMIALENNFLLGIEPDLRRFRAPVKIVWGASDTIFRQESAYYLDRLFPGSQGVRRVEAGRLFWPEEFPDFLSGEARELWRA